MSFAAVMALAVALLVGLPLLIVGLSALGPIGWVVAAAVLPLATLGVILWFGWVKRRPDDGPRGGPDTM